MRIALPLTVVAVVLACASPTSAQTVTRGDQTAKPTATPPARTPQTTPSRTPAPSALPVDPGSFGAAPNPGTSVGSPGPGGAGGVRTVRPRRSAAPASDPGEEIPYVDPPAAPGYETGSAAPMTTAGGRPAASAPARAVVAAPPTAPAAAAPSGPPPAQSPAPVVSKAEAPAVTTDAAPASPAPPDPLSRWIALGGLAAMLAAAALGLRHILTAPHLSFRVTVDHGVQSAPRFKGAAS